GAAVDEPGLWGAVRLGHPPRPADGPAGAARGGGGGPAGGAGGGGGGCGGRGRRAPPGVVGAARRRFMLGLVVYAVALALSWGSAPLALGLCGLMALYYAFDQASIPAAAEPDDHQPTTRSA